MEDGVELPEDVLIEILVNLPVKSLMRFRCVSNYWCALIKSPNFVSRHLNRDSNESVLLKSIVPRPPQDNRRGGEGEVLSFHDPDSLDLLLSPNLSIPPFLDYVRPDAFFYYMGTCNGLICLASPDKVVLCNPALREFELLPPSPFECPEGYHALIGVLGFGFDAITDAYKVVKLSEVVVAEKGYPEVYEDCWVRIDLYNSSTNSWKLIDAVVPKVIDDPGFNIFFNGSSHWHSKSYGILSFDHSTEAFQHFEYPHFGDEKVASLAVLNQCLSLVRVGGLWTNVPEHIEIWVMKEYGVKESWTKEFVIGPYAFDYPILLLKNEWLLVTTQDFQLASCALHGNEVKKFRFYDKDETMRAVIFKESLISLKQVIFGHQED